MPLAVQRADTMTLSVLRAWPLRRWAGVVLPTVAAVVMVACGSLALRTGVGATSAASLSPHAAALTPTASGSSSCCASNVEVWSDQAAAAAFPFEFAVTGPVDMFVESAPRCAVRVAALTQLGWRTVATTRNLRQYNTITLLRDDAFFRLELVACDGMVSSVAPAHLYFDTATRTRYREPVHVGSFHLQSTASTRGRPVPNAPRVAVSLHLAGLLGAMIACGQCQRKAAAVRAVLRSIARARTVFRSNRLRLRLSLSCSRVHGEAQCASASLVVTTACADVVLQLITVRR